MCIHTIVGEECIYYISPGVLPTSPTISLPTSLHLPALNVGVPYSWFHPLFTALHPPAPSLGYLAHSQGFSCHVNGDDISVSSHFISLITRLIIFHLYIMWAPLPSVWKQTNYLCSRNLLILFNLHFTIHLIS